jgi:hypothetical protein
MGVSDSVRIRHLFGGTMPRLSGGPRRVLQHGGKITSVSRNDGEVNRVAALAMKRGKRCGFRLLAAPSEIKGPLKARNGHEGIGPELDDLMPMTIIRSSWHKGKCEDFAIRHATEECASFPVRHPERGRAGIWVNGISLVRGDPPGGFFFARRNSPGRPGGFCTGGAGRFQCGLARRRRR